jgi:nucleoside-diphosphate-sugar epimerase
MLTAITGGTGFLGRYIVRQMQAAGHQCRCWYRPTSDRGGFTPDVQWLEGQLGNEEACRKLVRGADAVVHAGLDWRHRGGQGQDLLEFLRVNFMGTIQLMAAARQAGVPRFVFISTCAVHEVILQDRPLDETHPLWPTSPYGAHKAALEKFVHSYGLGEGWPICALRPTGIYGLAHPPSQSRWYDLVGQVMRGEEIASARGGKEVHALDVARAVEILLRADAKAIAGQAFNCYDRYVAEEEVARIAKELSGSKSVIHTLNRGPKNQIQTGKLRALRMSFGRETLLRETVSELVAAHQGVDPEPTK